MVYGSGLQLLIGRRSISLAVKRLAECIRNEYADKNPLLLGVLKGSFIFLSDLVRQLDFKLELDFVCCRSYVAAESTGKVEMVMSPRAVLTSRHVLLVEDIVDTGLTTAYLIKYILDRGPASLELCALLDKPSRRLEAVDIHYSGLKVPDKFIVGYGLDCAEEYRNLPDLYTLEQSNVA